jgi:hypothetical protein
MLLMHQLQRPEFDPNNRRYSGIWGASDEAAMNIVQKNNPPQKYF